MTYFMIATSMDLMNGNQVVFRVKGIKEKGNESLALGKVTKNEDDQKKIKKESIWKNKIFHSSWKHAWLDKIREA